MTAGKLDDCGMPIDVNGGTDPSLRLSHPRVPERSRRYLHMSAKANDVYDTEGNEIVIGVGMEICTTAV